MNVTNNYQFDVSADGTKKEDAVLSFLKETLEEKPDKEITKFLLYGNPNSSGLVTQSTNTATLAARDAAIRELTYRVQETYTADPVRGLVSDKDFNYEGLEKPTNKVTIPTRVSHAIRSYLNILDLAYLISAKMHVETALGNEWPKREHKDGKVVKIEGESSINRTTVRSLISRCQNELADTLPGIIDGMYQHKYRSVGAFTYSLAEIRCFQVDPRYIAAAAQWIIAETRVSPDDGGVFGEIADGSHYGTGVPLVGTAITHPRMLKAFEEWSKITYTARTRAPKYPALLDKFARTFATRLGKNLYTKEDAKYKTASLAVVTDLINHFERVIVPREQDEQTSLMLLKAQTKQKNDFQENMKNCILDYFEYQYNESAGVSNLSTVIGFMKSILFTRINPHDGSSPLKFQAINLDLHLVYVDRLMNSEVEMSRAEVYGVLDLLAKSNGIVNERTTNAILRFFAVKSDFDYRQKVSRKKLPDAIDRIVASLPNLSKIKLSTEDPALVLVHTDAITDPALKSEYASFKAASPTSGWLQKAVMSLLSAMKVGDEWDEAKILKSRSSEYEKYRAYFDSARNVGNAMDEISSLFEQYYSPYFNAVAKQTAEQEKAKKAAERQDKDREKWLKSQNQLRSAVASQGQVAAPVVHQHTAPVHQNASPVNQNAAPHVMVEQPYVHTQQVAAPVMVEQPYVPSYGATNSPPVAAGGFNQFESIPQAVGFPMGESPTKAMPDMTAFYGQSASSPSGGYSASSFNPSMMPSFPAFNVADSGAAELKSAHSHSHVSPKAGSHVAAASSPSGSAGASSFFQMPSAPVASPSGSAGSSSFNQPASASAVGLNMFPSLQSQSPGSGI